MVKVRCESCGNIQDTYGRFYYNCNKCNKKQVIENAIYEDNDNPTNANVSSDKNINSSNRNEEDNKQVANPVNSGSSEEEQKVPLNNQKEEVLEINEAQEDKDLKPVINAELKEYRCPECDEPVEEFEDCKKCGAEIIWEE